MSINARKLGSLLRRPATRLRGGRDSPSYGHSTVPRPQWMSETAYRDLAEAYQAALSDPERGMPKDELRTEFDLDAFMRPAWMSPEAFRRFKVARAELLSGRGREMTLDELRAEFRLGHG
jgi:hypothetical protein